jgi:hypothetical protein
MTASLTPLNLVAQTFLSVQMVAQAFLPVEMTAQTGMSVPPDKGMSVPADEALLEEAQNYFRLGSAVRQEPPLARPLFREAANAYTELIRRGYRTPEEYRNQGNALLLSGNLPRAILAYRLGLAIDPANLSLTRCLDFARKQVIYHQPENLGRPPPPSVWLSAAHGLRAQTYFVLAAILYTLACIAFAFWWMTRSPWALGVGGLLVISATLCGGFVATQGWRFQDEQAYPVAVIAEDGVTMRTGNGLSYPAKLSVPLNRGLEARTLYSRGDWLQIELLTGQAGWVPRRAVVVGD